MTLPSKPQPRCLTLIMCDYLILDKETHKPTLVGCTQHVEVPGFPCVGGPFWFFCEFTNGHGRFEFVLRVVDPTEQVLLRQAIALPLNNPLETASLVVQAGSLTLQRPGCHRIEITDTSGIPLIDRSLHVWSPGTMPKPLEATAET